MPRMMLRAAAWTALISVISFSSAQAQNGEQTSGSDTSAESSVAASGVIGAPFVGMPGMAVPYSTPLQSPPTTASDWSRQAAWRCHVNDLYEQHSHYLGPTGPVYYPPQGYPYLNAGLYPCPQPNTPYQVGSTLITNQALAPHEMLYPHTYRAMYPPYYYKVNGGWVITPCGVCSREHWQLQGTMVKVKYRKHYAPFSMFKAPVTDFGLGHSYFDFGIWD